MSTTAGRQSGLIAWGLLLGALAFSGCKTMREAKEYRQDAALATKETADINAPLEIAAYPKTPEEHRAAALAYREKFAQYRKEAAHHRRMKALYETAPHSMSAHCDRIVKKFEDLADSFDALAQWHEKQAALGGSGKAANKTP